MRYGNPKHPQGFLGLVREDLSTYRDEGLCPGLLTVLTHRFGNAIPSIPKPVRAPLTAAYKCANWVNTYVFGVKLDREVRLGRRVKIWHSGGMVLGARSIGDDVHIRQNTTFGVRNAIDTRKPIIERGVEIGCGSVILGAVRIGTGAAVGANSVVLSDVPSHSLAVGAPARVVRDPRDKARALGVHESHLVADAWSES